MWIAWFCPYVNFKASRFSGAFLVVVFPRNMLDIDILPGLTPLQLAAKHSCDRVAILLLLESKLGSWKGMDDDWG